MIYTVGVRRNYEQILDGSSTPVKLGKCQADDGSEYEGGCAFQTIEAAASHLLERGLSEYGIYGMMADWEEDTYQIEGEPFRRLKRDAGLVRLLH